MSTDYARRELEAAFASHSSLESVRCVHALYSDAIRVLRCTAATLWQIGEDHAGAAFDTRAVDIEVAGRKHIESIAAREAAAIAAVARAKQQKDSEP